jgi:hypothetical protein
LFDTELKDCSFGFCYYDLICSLMTHVLVEVPQGLCFFAASGFGCVCGYIDRGSDAKRNFWRAEEASDNR